MSEKKGSTKYYLVIEDEDGESEVYIARNNISDIFQELSKRGGEKPWTILFYQNGKYVSHFTNDTHKSYMKNSLNDWITLLLALIFLAVIIIIILN